MQQWYHVLDFGIPANKPCQRVTVFSLKLLQANSAPFPRHSAESLSQDVRTTCQNTQSIMEIITKNDIN